MSKPRRNRRSRLRRLYETASSGTVTTLPFWSNYVAAVRPTFRGQPVMTLEELARSGFPYPPEPPRRAKGRKK